MGAIDTIADLQLPAGIHATVLTGRDVVTGTTLAYPVVWADRPYDRCPTCHEPIATTPGCPVALNAGACQGGRLDNLDQQHHCGEWLTVRWEQVTAGTDTTADEGQGGPVAPGIRVADVIAAAQALAQRHAADIEDARRDITARLRRELQDALDQLAEDPDADVITGSEVEPGVYEEYGTLTAWDYDPGRTGETISVTPDDLGPRG